MTLRDRLLSHPSFRLEKNMFYQKELSHKNPFEEKYIELRKREQRVYSDDVVRNLPEFNEDVSLKEEWAIRKNTLKKLIKYLEKKNEKLLILELGCGNGWLSHNLAKSLTAEILGVDVNEAELLQGATIFKNYQNLSFLYADIFSADLKNETFDVILLASSIQYFPDLSQLVNRLLELTKPSGEIHFADTPIYSSREESQQAQKRSRDYFVSQGVPEMISKYFHHHYDELRSFNHRILFDPNSLISILKRRILRSPQPVFPWVLIKQR